MKKFLGLFLALVVVSSCVNNNAPKKDVFEKQLLQKIENRQLDKNVLVFTRDFQNQIFTKVYDGGEWGGQSFYPDLGKPPVLCEGNGLSFARCVQAALDAGKCLYVYKKGDIYVDEEITCDTPNNERGFYY